MGLIARAMVARYGMDAALGHVRYEDEGHGLAKLKNRMDAYPKMVAFLDKYLK